MTRPYWLGRAARNRHRHAIEQASRRWRGGRRDDSGRTRRKNLISTQVLLLAVGPTRGAEPDGLHVDDLCPVRALVPAGAEAHRRDRARVVASPPPAAAPVVSRISVPSSLVF